MIEPNQAAIDAYVANAFRAAAKELYPSAEDRAENSGRLAEVFLNGVAYAAIELIAMAQDLEAGK